MGLLLSEKRLKHSKRTAKLTARRRLLQSLKSLIAFRLLLLLSQPCFTNSSLSPYEPESSWHTVASEFHKAVNTIQHYDNSSLHALAMTNTMANLETPNTQPAKPSSPVPLDTIPVSPEGNMPSNENAGANGTATKKEYTDSEQITVFHDPDNFNVKHPLIHQWTLWFTKPPSGKVTGPELLYWIAFLLTMIRAITGMTCSKKLSLSIPLRSSGVSS